MKTEKTIRKCLYNEKAKNYCFGKIVNTAYTAEGGTYGRENPAGKEDTLGNGQGKRGDTAENI